MAHDAAATTLAHDLEHGLNPDRRSAPQEIWAQWHKLMAEHKARPLGSVMHDEKGLTRVAMQIHLAVQAEDRTAIEAQADDIHLLAWPEEMCA